MSEKRRLSEKKGYISYKDESNRRVRGEVVSHVKVSEKNVV